MLRHIIDHQKRNRGKPKKHRMRTTVLKRDYKLPGKEKFEKHGQTCRTEIEKLANCSRETKKLRKRACRTVRTMGKPVERKHKL